MPSPSPLVRRSQAKAKAQRQATETNCRDARLAMLVPPSTPLRARTPQEGIVDYGFCQFRFPDAPQAGKD